MSIRHRRDIDALKAKETELRNVAAVFQTGFREVMSMMRERCPDAITPVMEQVLKLPPVGFSSEEEEAGIAQTITNTAAEDARTLTTLTTS